MFLVLGLIVVIGAVFWVNANRDKKEVINTTFKVNNFNKIKIDSPNSDVKFQESDHSRVIYHGKKEMKPTVSVKNGTLMIESPQKDVEINADLFNWKYQKPKLTIEMPRKELDRLSIELSNGSVQANNLRVKKGSIDTSNGSINIEKLITKNGFSIETSNGSVTVGESNATGYDTDTSNGYISYHGENENDSFVKNESSDNVLEIDTSNGNIKVN